MPVLWSYQFSGVSRPIWPQQLEKPPREGYTTAETFGCVGHAIGIAVVVLVRGNPGGRLWKKDIG